jgi:streptogramin lyase
VSGSIDAIHAGAALHCWPSPASAVSFVLQFNHLKLCIEFSLFSLGSSAQWLLKFWIFQIAITSVFLPVGPDSQTILYC